ncbi:MAG: uracil-DNA glycosylase [Nitrosomonadales bacterium]|nr:uracil-DNA glycosylase [Nitrosomonadales bacterium]
MDRNEAMLRELNLYPQWKLRSHNVAVVKESAPEPNGVGVNAVAPTVAAMIEPISRVGEADRQRPAMGISEPVPREASPEPGRRVEGHSSPSGMSAETANFDWPQLKAAVHNCTACKLRAGCTQTVFGVGDERADWLFVGEGPGADEDALGEPFVGQAGKLLDNMLMAIKLKRGNKVYIANIVKCRPPGNRTPEADEIAACMPYLERQIALIQPRVIVALGKVASNALLAKDATLASLRGQLHDFHGTPLVVTYHPAYLLRTPSEKAKAWQDLCLAVETLADNSIR